MSGPKPGKLVYEVENTDGSTETYEFPDSPLGHLIVRFMYWVDSRRLRRYAEEKGLLVTEDGEVE